MYSVNIMSLIKADLLKVLTGSGIFYHHGTGDWAGRIASLLPVYWVDGWPIIGEVGQDGIGTMVWQAAKPSNEYPVRTPQSSDDFSKSVLSPQWEWNYQPGTRCGH